MKLLIIGASSFLGNHLYDFFQGKKDFSTFGTYFKNKTKSDFLYFDALNKDQVSSTLSELRPDHIIVLSGNKNLKQCELDYEKAYSLNFCPAKNVAEAVSENNLKSRIIFFSSDYVFEGSKGYYSDSDECFPKTNYGKTKLLAETFLLKSPVRMKILRTSAVMGKGGLFFEWLISALKKEKRLSMFTNVFFTPTPINFLCEGIDFLVSRFDEIEQKVIHLVGELRLNRFEFAKICQINLGNFNTLLEPAMEDTSTSLFKHDLSMIQSEILKNFQKESFETYLRSVTDAFKA
ncbi:MAG: sugar nucleotide-binding protein [Candidatus Riflebacteria bacterium]|nr:sugar nucleotide-binding protein [Candidatus Riflebacteria bacterium]